MEESTIQTKQLVGIVRHYYGKPHVAIVKFAENVPMRTRVQIGIRVATKVHRGDRVYIVK